MTAAAAAAAAAAVKLVVSWIIREESVCCAYVRIIGGRASALEVDEDFKGLPSFLHVFCKSCIFEMTDLGACSHYQRSKGA